METLKCHLWSARRAKPPAELSLSERSEDSAVNRALRARIRRKLEAVKQEATQLPRLNCLGRRESVLCTNGIVLLPYDMQSSRVPLLLYELELLNGSKVALRVMYYHHCAPARTPGHLSGHLGLSNGLQS